MYSFPILKQSTVPCPVLTAASWPAYRFLRRQVRWSGIPIYLRIFHCTQHTFIHSSIDRYLGCFHVLATVNNAVTNMQVQRTLWYATFISFRNIQKGDGWIIGSSILPEALKLSEGIDNMSYSVLLYFQGLSTIIWHMRLPLNTYSKNEEMNRWMEEYMNGWLTCLGI